VEYVIHLAPPANIPQRAATTLAQLAIRSATPTMQQTQQDGINYLLCYFAAAIATAFVNYPWWTVIPMLDNPPFLK
jgi:hypothetical protein